MRVTRNGRGFVMQDTMGIAEREQPADDDAYTVMGAKVVLGEAIAAAKRLGRFITPVVGRGPGRTRAPGGRADRRDPRARGLPAGREEGVDAGPLAGLFPLWYDVEPQIARASLEFYLDLAPGYIGSPMLSAFYGTWAAWLGDRRLSAKLFKQGYADLAADRYLQTLEQAPARDPETPRAGPFFANLGGFLMSLLYGLPGIRLGPGRPETWPNRPVVLPAGWRSIEVERAWVRMDPARIVARHGAERASIEVRRPSRRAAA